MQNNEPHWLHADEIIEINREQVALTGEYHHVRDLGLLESSAARPKNLWTYKNEEDVAVLSFSLLYSLARNHPFEQGNKRTAFMAALEMLKLNGYVYEAPDDESTAETIISAIAGHITEQDLIDRLTPYVSPS